MRVVVVVFIREMEKRINIFLPCLLSVRLAFYYINMIFFYTVFFSKLFHIYIYLYVKYLSDFRRFRGIQSLRMP